MWKKSKNKAGYVVIFKSLKTTSQRFLKITYVRGLISIKNGEITVKVGFECDGCSSSPNFSRAMRACIIHDALYKCLREDENCPFSRKMADKVFLNVMRTDRFRLSFPYYLAVRWFGKKNGTFLG